MERLLLIQLVLELMLGEIASDTIGIRAIVDGKIDTKQRLM